MEIMLPLTRATGSLEAWVRSPHALSMRHANIMNAVRLRLGWQVEKKSELLKRVLLKQSDSASHPIDHNTRIDSTRRADECISAKTLDRLSRQIHLISDNLELLKTGFRPGGSNDDEQHQISHGNSAEAHEVIRKSRYQCISGAAGSFVLSQYPCMVAARTHRKAAACDRYKTAHTHRKKKGADMAPFFFLS